MKKPPLEILITLLVFLILCCITLAIDTTGDNGDSILHYLYSREAFKHPEIFLNHWAKPLFVLLSAPFAQLGFKGIELFNCLCISLTALLTFYTAKNLNIKNPLLVFVFIFFAPLCFKLIFSGLTEYLFAAVLIAGVYFSSEKKHMTAAVFISFLPLVRSEGLLIIGGFGIYFLLDKNFKALLLLASGQLLYSIAGAFYYKDLLWVFNKIPYANMGSPYGHGKLPDMAHRLNYVIEKPIYLLLFIGIITMSYSAIRSKFTERNASLLVVLLFLIFFIAHSLFWWLGIFNSMGLPRVFIAVMPLIALISLNGLQAIIGRVNKPAYKKGFTVSIAVVICLYPFSYRPQGVVFNKTFFSVPGNTFITQQVAPYLRKEFPDYAKRRLYYNASYLSIVLDLDQFDENQHKELHHILYDTDLPSDAVVVWDERFSVAESRISLDDMKQNKRFELVKLFEEKEDQKVIRYAIFTVKNN